MPLLTYEQYSKTRHETPYTLVLQSGQNFLYYFGEKHSFDPADTQWATEKKFWNDFINATQNTKRIVFIEGGIRPYEESEEQSIIKHGGMGFATFLAHQEGIVIHSPEPNEKYERDELEKTFSREEIQYYYFARVVHQWGRKQEPKPDFEEYINRYLQRDQQESGWNDFDFSLEAMEEIHHNLFQAEFNKHDTSFFYSVVNPVVPKTVINNVSAMSSNIRDSYIINEIKKHIADGYSIFAQYGCSHVVMQEPALRELFEYKA